VDIDILFLVGELIREIGVFGAAFFECLTIIYSKVRSFFGRFAIGTQITRAK